MRTVRKNISNFTDFENKVREKKESNILKKNKNQNVAAFAIL